MNLSINQPAYMPWLGYFERIAMSDVHVVLDDVQFEKNSMTNRNKILMNGHDLTLTVPLKTSGRFGDLVIKDVEIDQRQKWIKKHRQSIQQAYSKAAFYSEVMPLLDVFFENSASIELLGELLKKNLYLFLEYFDIETEIIYASEIEYNGVKSGLVLDICQRLKADKYISGPFGRDYLQLESFSLQGIDVEFHEYNHPMYSQKTDVFVSHLSTLDLMFNYGKKSLDILMNVNKELS